MKKKFVMIFIMILFSLSLLGGGVFLLTDNLVTQTPNTSENAGGGFEDDSNENQNNSDKDLNIDDEKVEANSVAFTIKSVVYMWNSSSFTTTIATSSGLDVDDPSSTAVFDLTWHEGDGGSGHGNSKTWGSALTMAGTSNKSGGGKSDNYANDLYYASYSYSMSVQRYGQIVLYNNASEDNYGMRYSVWGFSRSSSPTSTATTKNTVTTHYFYSTTATSTKPTSSVGTSMSGTWYAHYRHIFLVYFMNGNVTSKKTVWHDGDGTVTVPSALTKTGYTFSGWSVNGTTYSAGATVASSKVYWTQSNASGESLLVNAVWTPNVYTITLDPKYYSSSSATSGTSVTSNGTTAIYEKYETGYYTTSACSTSLTSITLPTYSGYLFDGYYTGKAGTGTRIIASDGTLTTNATNNYFSSNTTLYAKWEKLYYLNVYYYRQYVTEATSYASYETTLQVTQSSCTVTDNYSTTTDGILGCDVVCERSLAYYATVSHTYSTSSFTVTITKQHSYGNYYMNATTSASTLPTTSSDLNSVSYTWTPTSNATIYVNVYQKTYCQIMYYQQNVTNTTGITVSSSGGVLSGSSLSSTSTSSFIYVYDIYSTTTRTITISRQNTSYNYNVDFNSTSGVNSNSYTWTPNAIVSVTVYVYQRYTITYNGNGKTGGTVPSTQYKIHGTSTTLASNNLTKTNYSANGWNTSTAYKATPNYTSSSTYSTNANLTLYANFVPNTCSVTIKLMTVTKTGTATNSTTGGTVSVKSTVYDTSSATLVTTQTVSITSTSATQTVLKNQTMTFTPTTTSGYVFCGVSTSSSVPTVNEITSSVTPTSATTLYVYFKETSNNLLKYDSLNDYYYFEDGYMPQSYAEMISSGLNANITNNGTLVGTYTLENGTTYKLASYSGYYYLGFTAPKTMSLTLESYTTSGTYSFTKGTWYWFRFEPIRWRVSFDDWSDNGYIGMYDTNYTVVSDLVLWYDCMDTNENHIEGDKAYDMSFTSSLRSGNFNTMLSAFASGKFLYSGSSSAEYQKFGETGQQNPVQVDKNYSSSLRVASTDEISDSAGNTKAKASCLVAFLMGSSNNQYSKYWTRDLGNNLNAGKVVAQNGLTRSEWLSNSNGIRFAYTMSEGSRGNL